MLSENLNHLAGVDVSAPPPDPGIMISWLLLVLRALAGMAR